MDFLQINSKIIPGVYESTVIELRQVPNRIKKFKRKQQNERIWTIAKNFRLVGFVPQFCVDSICTTEVDKSAILYLYCTFDLEIENFCCIQIAVHNQTLPKLYPIRLLLNSLGNPALFCNLKSHNEKREHFLQPPKCFFLKCFCAWNGMWYPVIEMSPALTVNLHFMSCNGIYS